ncbi:MAG: MFS transporter [Archangiaceae bacterium]|nr:MFS transporter [Archangiaceae bacterium]
MHEPVPAVGLSRGGVLAVACAGCCSFIDLYATQPLLPHLEKLLHLSKAQVGLTVSASTGAIALSAPLVGALADRFSRKRVIVSALWALAASTLLAATADGLDALLVWRFLQGVAIAAVYVVAITYLAEEVEPRAMGRALSLFVAGNVVGGFAGRFLAGLVTAATRWEHAFVVLGLLNVLGATVTALFLPPSRHVRAHQPAPLVEGLRFVTRPPVLATFATGFTVLFSLVAAFSYVGFHLSAAPFELGTASLSLLFSVYLVGALVTPFAGPAIDRFGSRAVLRLALLCGAAGGGLTLVPHLAAIIFGLAVLCSSLFVCQAAAMNQLRQLAVAPYRTLASGFYVTAYYLGGSAAGVVPALTWQRLEWPGCVGWVLGAHALAALMSLANARRPEAAVYGAPRGP